MSNTEVKITDLYEVYEKYCVEECVERRVYEPHYQGQVGICPTCRIDSFIGFVEKLETIKEDAESAFDHKRRALEKKVEKILDDLIKKGFTCSLHK